jgi:hypothetical protein
MKNKLKKKNFFETYLYFFQKNFFNIEYRLFFLLNDVFHKNYAFLPSISTIELIGAK